MKRNIGLDLLRILMSFGVVLCHFWHVDLHGPAGVWAFFDQLKGLAVPVFMLMTFLLSARRFEAADGVWLKRRLVRLWKPFLFWSVIAWCVAQVLFACSGMHKVDVGDLLLQLLLGANNNVSGQFWFHSNLIMLTIGFFVLFRSVRRDRILPTLVVLTLIGFTFQYTKLNLLCFGNLPSGVRQPFGRLCATVPFACLGLGLAMAGARLDSLVARARALVLVVSAWTVWMTIYLKPFPEPVFDFVARSGERIPTFGVCGFHLVVLALAFVVLFYALPFGRWPMAVSRAVEGVSRFCMGIYCTHMFLGWILNEYVFAAVGVGPKTFSSCVLLWLVAWVFCWSVSRIPLGFAREVVE